MLDTQLPLNLQEPKLSIKMFFKNCFGKEDRNTWALNTFLQNRTLWEILPQPQQVRSALRKNVCQLRNILS